MKKLIILLLLGVGISCQKPEPRGPVVKRSGQFLKKSSVRNKAIQEKQEEKILAIIEKDSLREYHTSSNGFWYTYEEKNEKDTLKPDFGDVVYFKYDISTLEGKPIYTKKEIGYQEYKMDKEDLLSGLRLGLKLMTKGETVTFYFPSSVAYDYYGDENKIGHYIPIRSTVTVDSIKFNSNKKNNKQLFKQ